jgi:hypothetical protein
MNSLNSSALSVVGAASAVNTAANLGAALASGNVGSALRSVNLPAAGAVGAAIGVASALFGGSSSSSNDWRVRLSMASAASFQGSPVLAPLVAAGGLVFPYTPTITINSAAKYSSVETTHTNYTFQTFKNSDPGEISITAPMNVEDATQGAYWLASVHYLRSLTKMFAGNDQLAGNPPPIIFLNGYGSYVFENVPVVVTKFTCSLPNDCDYITVNGSDFASSGLGGLGGILSAVGSAVPGLSSVTNAIGAVSSAVNSISNLASSLGGLGGGGGVSPSSSASHVPTKSEFSVTLHPIYSRDSSRNFSLDKFVNGGYLGNSFGYI